MHVIDAKIALSHVFSEYGAAVKSVVPQLLALNVAFHWKTDQFVYDVILSNLGQ